jgi:signal transduction histidine kinase/ActR/RegA family two-component response regulator
VAEPVDPAIQSDAEEAMLRLRTGTSNRVLLGVCAAGAVVVALAWSHLHWHWLVLWYCAMLASQGVRIWSEARACEVGSDLPLQERIGLLSMAAWTTGIAQGSSVLFFPLLDAFEQSLQTLILLVMVTGAVAFTAGHPRTYHPYLPTIVGSLVLAWWTLSTSAQERPWLAGGFGLLVAIYGFNLLGYARDTWAMFLNAAAMRHHEAQQSKRLALAVRAAEAASHAKTRFLAAASHDLRQPIHTIALLTGVLKLRHRNDASTEVVTLLDSVVQSLSHQLDDLLDISKLDAGVVKVAPQPLSLRRFLRRRLDEMQNDAQAKGLALRLDVSADAAVHTDPNLLERVLRNLLHNAVKFTERGEVVLALSVQADFAVVTVRDTGPGIAPQHQDEVFHEFVQLNNPERDRTKGMGLGLSIVNRLSRLMGVALKLRSAEGKGSTFELLLPLHTAPVSKRDPPPASDFRPRLDLTVLVVDDETLVRSATALLLEELGCRCLQAEDLAGALCEAGRQPPDFLIADFRLRGDENGIEVVRALREQQPKLPAVIVSGDIGPAQLQAIEMAGLPLLHKPMRLDTLIQLLGTPVDRSDGTATSSLPA